MADLLDFDVSIGGFARHGAALDAKQLDRLDTLAFYMVTSQAILEHRVFMITLVGHADSDPKGTNFEQEISQKRASVAQDSLWQLKDKWAPAFSPEIAFRSSLIFHTESGVGATDPVKANAVTEADRALNRRVVITVSHAVKLPDPPPSSGPGWQWPPPSVPIPFPEPDDPTKPRLPWWKLPPDDTKKPSSPFDLKLPELRYKDWIIKPDFDPLWKTLGELKQRLKL